jgi:hypothetical protein
MLPSKFMGSPLQRFFLNCPRTRFSWAAGMLRAPWKQMLDQEVGRVGADVRRSRGSFLVVGVEMFEARSSSPYPRKSTAQSHDRPILCHPPLSGPPLSMALFTCPPGCCGIGELNWTSTTFSFIRFSHWSNESIQRPSRPEDDRRRAQRVLET